MPETSPSDLFTVGPGLRGSGFRAHQVAYAPGYRRAAHAHDTTGITLLVNGLFHETANGREEEASTLSVVVKPAGTVHSDVVGPRGARTVYVGITDEAALVSEVGSLEPWRWLHAGAGVRPLLGLLRALVDADRGPDPEDMVLELLGQVADVPGPQSGDAPSWVRRAREALDDRAPEGMRVRDLAEQLGVHPVSLTRAFRRAYGMPVTAYRRGVRLRRAAADVVGSDRNLCDIAHATGYSDQAHMCRDVREVTGMPPSRLRKVARLAPPSV